MMKKLLAVAFVLWLGLPAADATILASCSEDVTCVFQGTVTTDATSGWFDSSYARVNLEPSTTGSTSNPPSNRVETNTFSSASADFWLTTKWRTSSPTPVTATNSVVFFDGATSRLFLRGTGVLQQIKLSKRDNAGTFTDLATASGSLCAGGILCKLDIHVTYAVAGQVDVYNNGVNILTYSGDVTTNSATTLNKAAFTTLGTTVTGWSEIIVSTTDTRSMRMVTCAPSAAGTSAGTWTGTFGNISANTFNDATFNYTTANNDFSEWKSGCTIPTSGTTSIVDVRSSARLAVGSTGPQNARFATNISSTDYDSGADLSGMTTSFGNFTYSWGTSSPAGGTWSATNLNTIFGAGGFGVKSRP